MEGTSADTKAGYVYVCFGNVKGSDVQQLHFFLSEDGLNWTALNGFHPLFEVGTDYADDIETVGTHNYAVKAGTDIKSTTSGDASVLFPFEGMIRVCVILTLSEVQEKKIQERCGSWQQT